MNIWNILISLTTQRRMKMNKRIQYRQMENLIKKMNEKIDSQNCKIESQSEIFQEFIGLLNAKQREGEDFDKFLRELA